MVQSRRELIDAAFHNERTDRVPVGFWRHFWQDGSAARPLLVKEALTEQERFIWEFRPDMINIMTDGFFRYPAVALNREISSPKDLAGLTPLGKNSDWFRDQIAYARALNRRYGRHVQLFYHLSAAPGTLALSQARLGHPVDIAEWLREDPEAVGKALDIISEDYAALAKALLSESGVDGIYLSVNNIDAARVPAEVYAKYVAPAEIKILEGANRVWNNSILHIGSSQGFRNHLEWYKEYPFLAVNWAAKAENRPLSEGKKLFGGRAVIGGFGQTVDDVIYKGTKEEIQAETRRILDDAGTTGVVLGADAAIPRDTPVEHLEWVRQAAEEYSLSRRYRASAMQAAAV